MARYIDADKLYKRVKAKTNPYGKPTLDYESGVKVLDMIEQEPTADVAEVKHGKWVDRYSEKYDNHLYECSECRGKALYEVGSDELGNIKITQALTSACPYCFAKMAE